MKIPKKIKESIIASANHSAIASEHNEKVRKWLEEKGLYAGSLVVEILIDTIEIGNNPHYFIDFVENERWN